MTSPSPSPDPRILRGFWLISAAVALAAAVVGATLARANLQLDRIESTIDEAAQQTSLRVQEAMASWTEAWLDTWLRDHEQPASNGEPLAACLEAHLQALDQVSVSANIVRFGAIEQARKDAEVCAAEVIDKPLALDFVRQLQLRWGAFLEQRGDSVPRFSEGERRGPGGAGGAPGAGGRPGAGRGGPPPGPRGGEHRGPPPGGVSPGPEGGPQR